jgi:DNA-binding IclR family transcriptional regulator
MPQEPISPDRLMQLAQGFMASRSLLSAVERGPGNIDELRGKIGLHQRSGRDFLDTLVALDLLDRDAAGNYANTPDTDHYLDRAKPAR